MQAYRGFESHPVRQIFPISILISTRINAVDTQRDCYPYFFPYLTLSLTPNRPIGCWWAGITCLGRENPNQGGERLICLKSNSSGLPQFAAHSAAVMSTPRPVRSGRAYAYVQDASLKAYAAFPWLASQLPDHQAGETGMIHWLLLIVVVGGVAALALAFKKEKEEPVRNFTFQEPTPQARYCADCGKQINPRAEICPHCGVRQYSGPTKPAYR